MGVDIFEIEHPNLNLGIRFKVLTPSEVEALVAKAPSRNDSFKKLVLENVVLNLHEEVTPVLRKMPKPKAQMAVDSLFHGAVMLNPGLDISTWFKMISFAVNEEKPTPAKKTKSAKKKVSKVQFLGLERYLKDRVIGQDAAISEIVKSLKRSQVGLHDERRPLAVFLFAGASGVGKTHLARELHNYLFGTDYDLARIDCGEFQHKHENAKLIGAPPGYMGYDDGGQLTNLVSKNPHTVVLLDEVEKAHPDVFHTFLRVFDEGILTDGSGKSVSFRDSIIIMTTNLGNRDIVEDFIGSAVGFGRERAEVTDLPNRERVERVTMEAVRKRFAPEFLNRIDKVVVFNHLTKSDFEKISELELAEVNTKLGKRGFSLAFDSEVISAMVTDGMNSIQGARRLAQIRRETIEDMLADRLLESRYPRGTIFQLTRNSDDYVLTAQRPKRVRSSE